MSCKELMKNYGSKCLIQYWMRHCCDLLRKLLFSSKYYMCSSEPLQYQHNMITVQRNNSLANRPAVTAYIDICRTANPILDQRAVDSSEWSSRSIVMVALMISYSYGRTHLSMVRRWLGELEGRTMPLASVLFHWSNTLYRSQHKIF